MIRILLADDHEMVRIGVSAYLQAQPDMEVVAEAINGQEAVEIALEHKPDIILMDMVMPDYERCRGNSRNYSKVAGSKSDDCDKFYRR